MVNHINNYSETTLSGESLLADYSLFHTNNGIVNEYLITVEVRGVACGDLWLNVVSVEAFNNNEETLIDHAVEELFESNIN